MLNIQWGEPRLLRQTADTIPFPLDALPPVLRNMAKAISVTTSTDVGMAGTAMLSAVGYCFSGMYRLAGKPDHTEPPILYAIIIAQPSERKSPVMHFIKEPFDSFESEYNKEHREEIYKAQQDFKALEARVKSMEKEDEPDTSAIAKLRVQAENIRNTSPIRIAVDDITPESLAIELSENGSLLMISDEAGMLSNFNGKYNGGIPNLDLILKAWNGERYISDRVIRGRSEIDRPYLSVAIAGQPYIWDNMMNDKAYRSSGLLARFILCFAESNVGNRRYDTAPIPQEVRNQYHDFIHQLLKGKKDHDSKETILHLSHKASDEYVTYCNNYIENEIKASMCCCQDWGGKFHGLILRIACILHCADCCSRGVEPSEESVNHDTIVRSFDVAHYYRYQAIYGFSTNAPDGNTIENECKQLCDELGGLLDGKLSIMKNKDSIIAKVQKLCKLVKKVDDNAYKSGNTIYSLHEKLDATLKECDDVRQRLKQTSGECMELRRNNSALQAQVDELSEFVSLLKRFEPQKYAEVRQTQEYIHNQREQEVQQQSTTKRKKSWGLE